MSRDYVRYLSVVTIFMIRRSFFVVQATATMSDSIVFPCDTPEWFDVKQKLAEARNVARSSLHELTVYLQKVTASATTSSRVRDCTGARPKIQNIYADLKHCLDDKIAVEERDAQLTRILLHAVDRAIAIETHRPSEAILAYRDNRGMLMKSTEMPLIAIGYGCM